MTPEHALAQRPICFTISLREVTLDESEVWPDNDGPENPTAADVVALMEASAGSVGRVLTDWRLIDEIVVFGNHDASQAIYR